MEDFKRMGVVLFGAFIAAILDVATCGAEIYFLYYDHYLLALITFCANFFILSPASSITELANYSAWIIFIGYKIYDIFIV